MPLAGTKINKWSAEEVALLKRLRDQYPDLTPYKLSKKFYTHFPGRSRHSVTSKLFYMSHTMDRGASHRHPAPVAPGCGCVGTNDTISVWMLRIRLIRVGLAFPLTFILAKTGINAHQFQQHRGGDFSARAVLPHATEDRLLPPFPPNRDSILSTAAEPPHCPEADRSTSPPSSLVEDRLMDRSEPGNLGQGRLTTRISSPRASPNGPHLAHAHNLAEESPRRPFPQGTRAYSSGTGSDALKDNLTGGVDGKLDHPEGQQIGAPDREGSNLYSLADGIKHAKTRFGECMKSAEKLAEETARSELALEQSGTLMNWTWQG
ncbi:uncharacterized protein DSM5745_00771 [Aspergillus mulundensis]|uniref:Myb-like domain-containing protein n=1 Tax=Aspergillus mulundensis TaxID=1810919 RepID=A0A3D8T4J2_9EURO|nr:hypothetical protein DSM5745_00771 [Aspergillus mulundensis]RDW93449.1 hypothetical protein DSM5745_00771 [Aspergillus mulundensis]